MFDHKYNLVFLHYPKFQHIGDFHTLRNMLVGLAPEVRTIILSRTDRGLNVPFAVRDMIAELPTLIFSPAPLNLPPEFRGTRIIGKQRSKQEEYAILEQANIPYPKSYFIHDVDQLDELDLGDTFVIKPNFGKQGRDVMLVERKSAKSVIRKTWPDGDLDIIAQRYIRTGDKALSYRCFTVFSEVIYCLHMGTNTYISEDNLNKDGFLKVASNHGERFMVLDDSEEVISFAEKIGREVTAHQVLGLDIIKEASTGDLYCVELNSTGWTWHLSSNYSLKTVAQFRLDLYGQRNGLHRIAKRLAEVVPRLAS